MTESDLLRLIREASAAKDPLLVAIDGRCGSGKTTLAARLAESLDASLFHMDDFFPRPEQRTPERLSQPGENVDHERFGEEVLRPLLRGDRVIRFRPFDCASMALAAPMEVPVRPVVLIEGSYSCHPSLWDAYDLRLFLTISPEEQFHRILLRNGPEKAEVFRSRWIPMEEAYFTRYQIQARCDHTLTCP